MSVYMDPDLPDPLHQTLKVYQSNYTEVYLQLKQLQENLNVLTLDVACFIGGSYYFCVQILLQKKNTNEVEEDIEQNVIEGEIMKKI